MQVGQRVAQLAPVELGHDHVGEHQSRGLAAEREDVERLPAVLRLDHHQAGALERATDQLPDRGLVLHDQHEALTPAALGSQPTGSAVRRGRELAPRGAAGQVDLHGGAHARARCTAR